MIKFITGKKCDRLVIDTNDVCASNPCWGESLCITVENSNSFRCLCPESRTGSFCEFGKNIQNQFIAKNGQQNETQNYSVSKLTNILASTKIIYLNNSTKSIFLSVIESNNSLRSFDGNLNINSSNKNNIDDIFDINNSTSNQKSILLDLLESKTCNSQNCQFGKCLYNGTCECTRPAFGKYCDQIDECLVLLCKNV